VEEPRAIGYQTRLKTDRVWSPACGLHPYDDFAAANMSRQSPKSDYPLGGGVPKAPITLAAGVGTKSRE
jgi:hypothetical protein